MEGEDDGISGFKSRVDKIFGSLSSSSSSKPAWSVSGEKIEKKEWLRRGKNDDEDEDEDDDEDQETAALTTVIARSSFDRSKKKKKKLNDFDDDDGDDDDDGGGGGGGDDEESEIRISIGLDPTLDFEAEEDEYDKVAEGKENAGERLYMSDVTDHGPYLNSHNVLPESVHDTMKDTRANHFAAKARLEEDKAESLKFPNPLSRKISDGFKPKPVLKSKDSSSSSKAQRRVRFDPYCKIKSNKGSTDNLSSAMPALQTTASDYQEWVKTSPAVPDYLLNPSKYKRYSFDSTSEVDDMKVLKSVKPSSPDEVPLHHLKFTPRKKENGVTPMDSSSSNGAEEHKQEDNTKHSGFARGIPAVEKQPNDDMDVEDEQEVEQANAENQKPSRRYRPRPKLDDIS